MNLYSIDRNIEQILNNGFVIDDETGEILFDASNLDDLKLAESEKINNIIGYLKDLAFNIENLKKIEKEYEIRANNKQKKYDYLKNYLESYLKNKNMTQKAEYQNGIISFRKSKNIVVNDENNLINYLLSHKESESKLKNTISNNYKINKKEIKKCIDENVNIPYVSVKENVNLQIK